MRTIRFRAWNGRGMEYGGFSIHAASGDLIDISPLNRVTDRSPLMQFTGLHDKNGKEIYEGDIIKAGRDVCSVAHSKRFAGFVVNKNGWLSGHFFGEAFEGSECEVIGNIHENPELLEPAK